MATNGLGFDELKPYKSIILGEVKGDGTPSGLVENCLDDIRDILNIEEDRSSMAKNRNEVTSDDPESSNEELEHGFLHYELEKSVTWTTNDEITDVENHLILLTMKSDTGFLALYISENSRRRSIRDKFGNGDYSGLGQLKQIAPETLNAAFFGDEVRTLWMSGMHRRVPVKADSKVLSGPNLKYALDPINDQTFYYSAARSHNSDLGNTVGISPKKSQIWTQRSSSWADYEDSVDKILQRLNDEEEDEPRPLPVLAEFADTTDVGNPYEFVIQPPELFSQGADVDDEQRERLEVWAYEIAFDVIGGSTSERIEANMDYQGETIGTIIIELDTSDPLDVEIEEITTDLIADELPDELCPRANEDTDSNDNNEEEDEDSQDILSELREICEDPTQIKIYFDSGHTLSNGAFYKAGYRDQRFDDFIWVNFDGYYITKEKPTEADFPSDNGDIEWDDNEPSLFKWVFDNWPPSDESWDGSPRGWLACDDGSKEVADFVHFTTRDETPVISLIHVKSAGNDSPGREISVAQYEKVTGQAVKNLRNLDYETLGAGLGESISDKIGRYVWKDGELADRADLVDELEGLGSDYERHVVVVQPHVQKAHRNDVLEDEDSRDVHRLKQLDTLLLGAKNACSGLGAEFHVISADE